MLRSGRSNELGTLSRSRGEPEVAHGNYFYQQWMKGELVREEWEMCLRFVNPLTRCSSLTPRCPCCTSFWVSRVSV